MSVSILPNTVAATALMSHVLVRANVVSERKRGVFSSYTGPSVCSDTSVHKSLSSSVEFTAGMYESDQPLMRGQ